MRIKFLHLPVIVLLLFFASSCRKDKAQEELLLKSSEVKFSAAINGQLRTTTVNDSWTANDAIGVFMKTGTGLSNVLASNRSYKTNGDGQFTASATDQTLFYPEGGSVDFIAYYPYQQTLTGTTYPVNVADQSNPAAIDLLYADNARGLNKGNPNAQLVFAHQLSKIEITVKNGTGVPDLNGLKVNLTGLKTMASFDLGTGTLSGHGQVATIPAKTATQHSKTIAEAIVLPTSGETDIKAIFLIGSKSFTWTLPAGTQFEQGKKYTYEIELVGEGGNSGIAASLRATIVNWADVPSGDHSLIKEPITTNPPVQSGYMEMPLITTGPNTSYVMHNFPGRTNTRNFAMLYDKQYKVAYWVAYPLHASYIGSSGRTDAWAFDPLIPQGDQVDLSSSFGNGYDRGHQIPSGDRTATRDLNETTFYYSNMTAQVSSMNQGIWNNLEQQVRTWMGQSDTLYVVTGAAIKTVTDQTITYAKGSAIPKYYYKALAMKKGDVYYTIGFKINNQVIPSATTYNNYRISVADLETETGFTFFPKLSENIKSTIDNTIWN